MVSGLSFTCDFHKALLDKKKMPFLKGSPKEHGRQGLTPRSPLG
jgi:hypothetical protein